MIRLEIKAPLPSILGISEKEHSLLLDYPFQEDMTLGLLLERLCADYPSLAAKKRQHQELFSEYLLVVNNQAAARPEDTQRPLADGSVVLMVAAYHGG